MGYHKDFASILRETKSLQQREEGWGRRVVWCGTDYYVEIFCRGRGQKQEDLSGRDQEGMIAQTRVGTVEKARGLASTWFESRTSKISCKVGGGA